MADLRDNVALVTAGASSVGRGIAEGLAEAGCTVYLADRPAAADAIAAGVQAVSALGGRAVARQVDFGNAKQVAGLFAAIYADQGRLDVLVNNRVGGTPAIRSLPDLLRSSQGLLVNVLEPDLVGEASQGWEDLKVPAGSHVTSLCVCLTTGSPRFAGRCVAALAMDPDIADKHGGRFDIDTLAREYRFSELAEPCQVLR